MKKGRKENVDKYGVKRQFVLDMLPIYTAVFSITYIMQGNVKNY